MNRYEELRTRYAEILKRVEKERTLVAHFMGDLPEIARQRLGFPLSQIKFCDMSGNPHDKIDKALSCQSNGWHVQLAFTVCADANCKTRDVSLFHFFITIENERAISVSLSDGEGQIELSLDDKDSINLLADRIFHNLMKSYGESPLSEFVNPGEVRQL